MSKRSPSDAQGSRFTLSTSSADGRGRSFNCCSDRRLCQCVGPTNLNDVVSSSSTYGQLLRRLPPFFIFFVVDNMMDSKLSEEVPLRIRARCCYDRCASSESKLYGKHTDTACPVLELYVRVEALSRRTMHSKLSVPHKKASLLLDKKS